MAISARPEQKLVEQGVSYRSKEMRDAYKEFSELDELWKEMEKQHLELRDEILRDTWFYGLTI